MTSVHRPDCTQGAENAEICACDPQCAQYGDCCRSSPYFVPEQQRLGATPFTCMNLLFPTYIYVMTTCPPDWKDSDTRYRCEQPDSIHRDPLLDAPVTSMSTNITYHNWHCAYCHDDLDANTTVIWNAKFKCNDYFEQTYVPDETFAEHLSFNPLTSMWNLKVSVSTSDVKSSLSTPGYKQRSQDNNTQEIQYDCFVTFSAPETKFQSRWCQPGLIGTCSEDWKGSEVKAQCEAYTARVCSRYTVYRNYHCLLCNNQDFPRLCVKYVTTRPPALPSITMLLDWKRLRRNTCASSEIYDPFSHVCRKVFL